MEMIEQIWEKLDSQASKNVSGILKKLVTPESPLYISIGIYVSKCTHFISYELSKDNIRNFKTLPKIKGLDYQEVQFRDEKAGYVSLVLSSASELFNSSFNILSEDLIENTKNIPEKNIINALADRLGMWKKFFSNIPIALLSEEKQIGLAGELDLIIWLSDSGIPISLIIASWKGFESSSKDFNFGNSVFIEAKSSKSPRIVKISSKEQLDEVECEVLFLYYGQFANSSKGKFSLNVSVDQIRVILQGNLSLLENFEHGLRQYGYYDIHREYYNRCYDFKKQLCFAVKDDFPRIKKADVRTGVDSINYIIDLTVAERFELPFENVVLAVKGIYDG